MLNVAQKAPLPKPPPISYRQGVGVFLDLPLPAVHATISQRAQGEIACSNQREEH